MGHNPFSLLANTQSASLETNCNIYNMIIYYIIIWGSPKRYPVGFDMFWPTFYPFYPLPSDFNSKRPQPPVAALKARPIDKCSMQPSGCPWRPWSLVSVELLFFSGRLIFSCCSYFLFIYLFIYIYLFIHRWLLWLCLFFALVFRLLLICVFSKSR